MTKADLVEQVSDAIGPGVTKKDCALIVDGFLNALKHALARGENIEIRGFGTFKVNKRKPRTARNPRTGDAVPVPTRDVPVFKPSKDLRQRVEAGSKARQGKSSS
jgi:integration host factor beta subunit